MKTMLELLIRLHDVGVSCERALHNAQLTDREKASVFFHNNLVRECLPDEVLAHYDRLKESEPELLSCPEMFAMAVLVSTWQSLSPAKRTKLAAHFVTPGHHRSSFGQPSGYGYRA